MSIPKDIKSEEDIIGKVILKGKRHLYDGSTEKPSYHGNLKAGDLMFNGELVLLTLELLNKNRSKSTSYDPDQFLEEYIKFLTSEGTHNDSYIETHHKNFVLNHLKKKPLRECAPEKSTGGMDHISGLKYTPIPLFSVVMDYLR